MDLLREYVAEHTGIVLPDNKNYLIECRLRNILTESRLPSTDDLIRFIENHPGTSILDDVLDAITTHETFWFRDNSFYDYLGYTLLPALLKELSDHRSVDVWSAACSSGQEAYSFSMVVEEYLSHAKSQERAISPIKILGTDISKHVIQHARDAIYTPVELSRGLSDRLKRQYFDTCADGSAKVKESVRQRTRFHVHNLMDRFDTLGTFDVVLCRNVLIYFDEKKVESILRRIHAVLRKGGVLFLGTGESIHGLVDLYSIESTPAGFMYRAI